MKAAFPVWNDRLAPVFDVARRLCLVDVASGHYFLEQNKYLPDASERRKVQHLTRLGVDELICGAISRPLYALSISQGISVTPFIAGDLRKIIRAWLDGTLLQGAFTMAGCGNRDQRFYGITPPPRRICRI